MGIFVCLWFKFMIWKLNFSDMTNCDANPTCDGITNVPNAENTACGNFIFVYFAWNDKSSSFSLWNSTIPMIQNLTWKLFIGGSTHKIFRAHPQPNGTQFFCCHIFSSKSARVSDPLPPNGSTPPTGNPESPPDFNANFNTHGSYCKWIHDLITIHLRK